MDLKCRYLQKKKKAGLSVHGKQKKAVLCVYGSSICIWKALPFFPHSRENIEVYVLARSLSRALSLAFGLALSPVFGLALSPVFGLALSLAFGLALSLAFGLALSPVRSLLHSFSLLLSLRRVRRAGNCVGVIST